MRRNDENANTTQYQYLYYSGTNRLRNTTVTGNNYQYDAAGNVIANPERNINRITYDHRNLAQHISTDAGLHSYTYNPEGLRIGKQYSPANNNDWTVNKRYIYGAYGELIAQFDGATVDYWNISGPEGETIGRKGLVVPPVGIGDLISMEQGNYIGYSRFYYLKDHLGSVRVTLGQDGTVVGHDDYYPFGLQMPGRSNNSANRDDDQKFTGHFLEQEGDLGIYHAQARMYDPAIGRFLGVDAMRSDMPGWNPYHYTFNNPVKYVDPDGNHPAIPAAKAIVKGVSFGISSVRTWRAGRVATQAVVRNPGTAGDVALLGGAAGITSSSGITSVGQQVIDQIDRGDSSLSTGIELQMTPEGEVIVVPESNVAPPDNLSAGTVAPSGSTAYEQYIQNGNEADPNIGKTTGSGGQIPDNSGWKGRLSRGLLIGGAAGRAAWQIIPQEESNNTENELEHQN